jgi:hypothetical protein
VLEGADKWGSNREDGPLTVCGRAGLGTGWRRGVYDVLVTAGDVGPVGGRVERSHGEGWVWEQLCGEVLGGGGGGKEMRADRR